MRSGVALRLDQYWSSSVLHGPRGWGLGVLKYPSWWSSCHWKHPLLDDIKSSDLRNTSTGPED